MKPNQSTRAAVLAALFVISACGGDGSADSEQAARAQAPDTSVKTPTREPLTEVDLADLNRSDVVVELPWTTNEIARDPAAQPARSAVQDVSVSEHEGFDRAVFRFGETTEFPGYTIDVVEAGTTIPCGDEERSTLGEGANLIVRIAPARASDRGDVWVPVRTRALTQTRFGQAGVICDSGQDVVWAAGLAEGDEVRVLEMRSPRRLVVDVR